MLLKSSDMYFEYSKCRTLWIFDIRIYGWFLFSLQWQRSVIFSLQSVLMVKNEPHFLWYNNAIVLCCIPPTQCEVVLLLLLLLSWLLRDKNADFLCKPIALNRICMLKEKKRRRMYRQSCHNQKLYSKRWAPVDIFPKESFNPLPIDLVFYV